MREENNRHASADALGVRILNASRNELTLSMRFMAAALNSLTYVRDMTTTTLGTDAVAIRFNPNHLFRLYIEEPANLNRAYIHILLHCLFRHMFALPQFPDPDLFDLCCDIQVESVIDSMDYPSIRRVTSDYREQWYARLSAELPVLSAGRLYRYFEQRGLSFEEAVKLQRTFFADDHGFWRRLQDAEGEAEKRQNEEMLPQELIMGRMRRVRDQWDKTAKRVQSELDLFSKEASKDAGALHWVLQAENDTRTDFRAFLKKLAVVREEMRIDPDSFDYGMYHYGMELYGNLPLIEENEVREAKKIEQLVIAIDTSASCSDGLVQRFLNETVAILRKQESFFHRVDVRIIECDNRVQKDIRLGRAEEIEHYAKSFAMKGGYGTDFRPVFAHVEQLRKKGELKRLKGLMYFTDGFGDYPKKPTPYDTAFVFDRNAQCNDREVPPWAMRLYI